MSLEVGQETTINRDIRNMKSGKCYSYTPGVPYKDLHESVFSVDPAAMDLEMVEIERAIQNLENRRALTCRQRNQHIPIAKLPFKIMSKIFTYAFLSSEMERKATDPTVFPMVLGSVCHSWRCVAWTQSELWATIHFQMLEGRSASQAKIFSEWLGRAGPRPLSVSISMKEEAAWNDPKHPPTDIIDALIPYSDNLKHLDVVLPENWYEKLLHGQGQFSDLMVLIIRPPSAIFLSKPLRAFLNARNLRHLDASYYHLADLHFKWARLTSIALKGITIDEALELIGRCKNLVRCRFEDLSVMENSTTTAVTSPRIQDLDVSLDDCSHFDVFLNLLALPNLRNLSATLPENHISPILAIEALMDRSICPLQVVSIKGPDVSDEILKDFLSYNDSILTIKVACVSPGLGLAN